MGAVFVSKVNWQIGSQVAHSYFKVQFVAQAVQHLVRLHYMNYEETMTAGARKEGIRISNLHFAEDISLWTQSEGELQQLVENIYQTMQPFRACDQQI